jgi:large subunit ribosomal protein L5
MQPKLKTLYKETITPNLVKSFDYKNVHQVPKLLKIQLNRGLGLDASNSKILQKSIEEFRLITGQQPVITKSKKAVAGFKIREDMALGITVTLREVRMFEFLNRFINLVLPRIRDFQGDSSGFDKHGNYNIALKEQLIFPEIEFEQVDQIRGLNLTFVTSAKSKEEGYALLKEFGLPFS